MSPRRLAIFICICFACALPGASFGQLSATDSVILQEKFSEPLYVMPSLYPGNWYVHPQVNTPQEIDSFLNHAFKFASNEFESAYRQIGVAPLLQSDTQLNATFNQYYTLYGNAYKQLDPLVRLNFELNGKAATAYSTYTPTQSPADHEIAFLVIPGSNANQTSELMIGDGYHNSNCYVKNTLSAYGDVFILCKPLEDYRALQWNDKKLNSGDYLTPGLNYIYTYLDSIDRPYGINYMIEGLALMKYLHGHYKKVMLLGCSQGGYASLLVSLNAEPDATLIASGYSKYIDEDPSFQFALMQNFKTLPLLYDSNTVRNKLSQSTSDYLFAWPDNDSYWYQVEHDQHKTQSFFGNLKNCSYFYDYTGHSFPGCYTIDTFIQKAINKPKLFFTRTGSLPNGQLLGKIDFSGHGPFSFNVYRDHVLFQHVDWVSSSFELTLPENGQYYLGDITNLNGDQGYCFDTLYVQRISKAVLFDSEAAAQARQPLNLVSFLDHESTGISFNTLNGAKARVFNAAGQEIAMTLIKDGKLPLDMSSWPAGMYIVHICARQEFKRFKFYKTE